jgi:hypothetical protein
VKHPIDPFNSQYHDMHWVDIDADGQCELVTSKRYRAHNDRDPGSFDDYGTYYQFMASADVELVHVTSPSSGGRLDKWVVWAKPADDSVTKVFRGPLQELITRLAPFREVIIHEQGLVAWEAFAANVEAGACRNSRVQHRRCA